MHAGRWWIETRTQESRDLFGRVKVATRLSSELSAYRTGHAPIDIADGVMIANRVNLVTSGHLVEPDRRRDHITAEPIAIGTNVWIATAATILPGVTIGAGSVVAAGAVVSDDVPPATLVAGVPATAIRQL